MKRNIHLFLSLILWISPLLADREKIYVDLAQETPLERVYIHPAEGYLGSLISILQFDFNHNGKTKVETEKTFCNYELTLSIHNETLRCQLLDLSTKTGKVIDGITLTHTLCKDRQAVHHLADTLFKTLYHLDGIASTRFLYTSKNSQGYELWEADYDGANKHLITRQKEVIVTPCYFPAPPGKKPAQCLFVSYIHGEPKLFLTPLKEFQPKRVSHLKGNQLTPTISRQLDKIAFVSDTRGNPDLYMLDLSQPDAPRRIYGFPKAAQASPTFSPDGQRIAFVSNKDGSPRIYSLSIPHPDQKIRHLKPELLTTLSKESTAPAWSPDGKKLAYCARDGAGIRQIYLYDFVLKKEKALTTGDLHKENPTWGPDSLHLLYNTACDKESAIYLMNLNEKTVVKIELGQGEMRFPSWS